MAHTGTARGLLPYFPPFLSSNSSLQVDSIQARRQVKVPSQGHFLANQKVSLWRLLTAAAPSGESLEFCFHFQSSGGQTLISLWQLMTPGVAWRPGGEQVWLPCQGGRRLSPILTGQKSPGRMCGVIGSGISTRANLHVLGDSGPLFLSLSSHMKTASHLASDILS